jgi:hypothetical protein
MNKSDDLLLKSVSQAYDAYIEHGPRSTAKLETFHGYFHDQVEARLAVLGLNASTKVRSQRNTEMKVTGALYPKMVDIAVEKGGKCIGGISLKFVVTNYKQNANNYFEHLMGETANIRTAGIPYASYSVIPIRPKYLAKAGGNARGSVTRTEQLTRENVLKYINLSRLSDSSFRPHPLGLCIVDLDSTPIVKADLSDLGLSSDENLTMESMADTTAFIQTFCDAVAQAAR